MYSSHKTKDYATAFAKLDQIMSQVDGWREALRNEQREAAAPHRAGSARATAEKVEFSINGTHIEMPRKSVAGATMKVHYVGKLISTGKILIVLSHGIAAVSFLAWLRRSSGH